MLPRNKLFPTVMQWYYSKNSTQHGPVSEAELREKLITGEIALTDLVWSQGMPDWTSAANVPQFARVVPTSTPPFVPASQPAGNISSNPYVTPSSPESHASQLANIPNYLWQSIVVTILCCWPLGIPAIVYAAKVDGLKATGNIQDALAASANAKNGA